MIVGAGKNDSGRRKPPVRLEPKDDRSGIVVGRKALPTVAPRKLRLAAPVDPDPVPADSPADSPDDSPADAAGDSPGEVTRHSD
jgi:hypothetical protein